MAAGRKQALVVGVDTGGTFTDIVWRRGPEYGRLKLLSTPADPARAVLDGLARLFAAEAPDLLTYGTTVATNAMLERRGARTVLLTTAGFEDVLEIGRQTRPELYQLEPRLAEPLIPRSRRLGVDERNLHDGGTARRLTRTEVARVAAAVAATGAESVAVCLLHAGTNPAHERTLARALERLGIPVTLSHELSPAPGEYERSATVAANAYVRPKVARHIEALERHSGARRLRVMQSNGGATAAATACREPVRTMLSGPAGGVAAAAALARRLGLGDIVTVDMGGTSTDVALVAGAIPRQDITTIGDIPVRTPSIDIHTVGAGGGSIAWVDEGGSLKVGPRSAGADPGPACYGRGAEPVVTDANAVLGRLRPERFLGGDMTLDVERAKRALAPLARTMGAASVEAAAEGIVRVVEGNMERALRVITVERGHDPRACTLMAFGGAAALHACGLAEGLGMARIVVPVDPGLLSATGVLHGEVLRDEEQSLRLCDPDATTLRRAGAAAMARARDHVLGEGIPRAALDERLFVRARYLGQSLELELPWSRRWLADFHDAHERRFHHRDDGRSVEVVGLRATARGSDIVAGSGHVADPPRSRRRRPPRPAAREDVWLDGRLRATAIHERGALAPGDRIDGPAIVTEYSSTTLVAPGWQALVLAEGSLSITRTPAGRNV
jgi:N-methylhydantoinase A